MHAYFVTRPLTFQASGQRKTLRPAENPAAPMATEVHVPSMNEIELLRTALRKGYPNTALDDLLHVLDNGVLASLPQAPVVLGAAAMGETADLVTQLAALKEKYPGRGHFRLLLINAFGGNLGDNLLGLSAFRQVLPVLRAHLPGVSVDVLLGWHESDGLARLFRGIDGIDAVLAQGLMLAEITRYQVFFDFTGLLGLPRYGTLPMADWYLWWMGVDAGSVAASDKRNAVAIPTVARGEIARRLPAFGGPRILINPKASVALRSMPEAATRRLLEFLLEHWPEAEIVLCQPLDFAHPRVRNVADALVDIDRLAALIAQVDGLIGVDTFTQHLADATSTPAVTVYTCVRPDLYPYYPLVAPILLPGAKDLPAWGRMKTTPEEWADLAESYAAAWQALDLRAVLAALREVMARKAAAPETFKARVPAPASPPPPARHMNGAALPTRQRDDPLAGVLRQTILNLAKQVLYSGDTVAMLGAGAGELALPLARRVGQQGRLIAFEPRRELFQSLCANLAGAGIRHAETHAAMPDGEALALREVHRLYLDDEHLPMQLANSLNPEPLICWPFDALALKSCALLVVCAPLPLLSCLQSARETLRRLRPVVVAGILPLRASAELEHFLVGLKYRVKMLELGASGQPDVPPRFGILLAEPAEALTG